MALSAKQLRDRGSRGVRIHPYPVSAWNGDVVLLRELNGLQIHEWDTRNAERNASPGPVLMDKGTAAEHMVQLSLVDVELPEGVTEPLDADGHATGKVTEVFTGTREDRNVMRSWGAAVTEIYQACLMLNRMRNEDVETVRKNLSLTRGLGSGATSQTGAVEASEQS